MLQTVEKKVKFKINSKTFKLQLLKKSALQKPFLFFYKLSKWDELKKLRIKIDLVVKIIEPNFKWFFIFRLLLWSRRTMSANDLRAREGRETNALYCKPITNLKEKYELSNFSKTSGFILHTVMHSIFHALQLCFQNNVHLFWFA